MNGIKEELVKMFNKGLELEHAARVQYLAHAELIKGINSEKIIERLTEIASDEEKHEGMFRNIIGNYLGGEPSMSMSQTHKARETKAILEINLTNEKEAIDYYKETYKKLLDNKDKLKYEFEKIEHTLRHIITDEQEHVAELSLLLGL